MTNAEKPGQSKPLLFQESWLQSSPGFYLLKLPDLL